MLKRWLSSTAIGFATALLPLPAAAQQAASSTTTSEGQNDETIVVTARRVEENVERIPVAVTALSGADIRELAIHTPLDLNKVAGLGGAPVGSLTSVNFTIRGQGTAFAGQPGVIPYFAEVPGFPLSYFDLRDVEVIKGPQGTLFGQTSTGGVVLFEPTRPSDHFGGYLNFAAGNYGYEQVGAALDIPVVPDRLLLRAAFQGRYRDGWARGIYNNGDTSDLNNLDNSSWRVSAVWRPTDNLESYTLFAHDSIENNGTASPLYYIDPRFMNPAARNLVPSSVPSIAAAYEFWTGTPPPVGQTFSQLLTSAFNQQLVDGPLTMRTDYRQHNTTINNGWVNQTTWNISDDISLKNIFGLRWQTVQGAIYDQDATNLPLLDFQCRFVPGTTSASGQCARTGGWPERTLTDELRLQGNSLSDRLQWQLGLFYLEGGSREFRESTRPFVVFGNLSGDPASSAFCSSVNVASPCAAMARTETYSYAAFGQATYEILPRIRLTAGYRETWDYTRTDTTGKPSYRVPFNGQLITVPVYGERPAPGATIVSTVVDLPANGSYNVSADWQVTDNLLLYAARRSGYKTGGVNVVANPGTPERTYGPERVYDVELGAKFQGTLAGMALRLDADVYHSDYSNIQEGEIIPGTAQTVTTNLANATIDGVEVQGAIYITDWLRLAGNIAYTDASYTDWLEHSTCAAQYWRPQCAGLAGSTEIAIDHAHGMLSVAGQNIDFRPDRFANASRWQWSFQPSVMLQRWLGEDVTISANIYHRGPYVDATAVANTSKLAGVPPLSESTVFGYSTSNPYDAPGYTLTDIRLDWRHALGSSFDLAAGATNVTNKIYRVSSASAFEIIGDVYTITGEPRMWYLELRHEF